MNRYCPVCWTNLMAPTPREHIADHFDTAGLDICPMSGERFALAGFGKPRRAADPSRRRPSVADRVSAERLNRLEKQLERMAA